MQIKYRYYMREVSKRCVDAIAIAYHKYPGGRFITPQITFFGEVVNKRNTTIISLGLQKYYE